MARIYVERNADGSIAPIDLPADQSHTLVLRTLDLDHRYHDDDPIQQATFVVRFQNGSQVSGQLDAHGRARLMGVPAGPAEVRYGPDNRDFEPVPSRDNPDYRPQMSGADVDALIDKYRSG